MPTSARDRHRYRVGLIADTHGLLRPEALVALRGSDVIVHAGDIGHPSILERLGAIAPLTAVRGNNDRGDWAAKLPDTCRLEVASVRIVVLHDLADFPFGSLAERVDVVIAGHSHRPICERRDGLLHVNPGSAGPRRFRLPVSVGSLSIIGNRIDAKLISLDVAPAGAHVR